MSTEKNNIGKFSVEMRQESAFNASRDNAKAANEITKATQNWLLVLSLAELSFLGTIFFRDSFLELQILIFLKIFIALLLLSFLCFFLGSFYQRKHVLLVARKYLRVAEKAVEYNRDGNTLLDKEPKDLLLPEQKIVSSSIANDFFKMAILLIFTVTIGLMFLIIFW